MALSVFLIKLENHEKKKDKTNEICLARYSTILKVLLEGKVERERTHRQRHGWMDKIKI